jgi:predicted GNAT family acetyltransferase
MPEDFHVHPLTAERWEDFEILFGPQGACYGCWCTYFRVPSAARKLLDAPARKAVMHRRVADGPAPGVIGYIGEIPVAWVQVCPRNELPQWNSPKVVSRPLGPEDATDPAVWAVSCFFMASRQRGKGLSHRMLSAAIEFAGGNGARVLEACPIDRTKQSKSVGLYVGSSRIFDAAGFSEVARRKDGRPLMRLDLVAT